MKKCMCPPCSNSVANRLQARLNSHQKDMLGYFCTACIMKECNSQHKGRKQ